MVRHSAANLAIYVNATKTRSYSRNVDFCTASAPDFGLHVLGQWFPIHEINGV